MKRYYLPMILLAFCVSTGCVKGKKHRFPPNDTRLVWQGRTWEDKTGYTYLIGSASSLTFSFTGDRCKIWIQNAAPEGEYNYISMVIDGEKHPRMAIRYDSLSPVEIIPGHQSPSHVVEIYKETEAATGAVVISAIEADSLLKMPASNKKRIEFIGNSITVGMSSDASAIACDAGSW